VQFVDMQHFGSGTREGTRVVPGLQQRCDLSHPIVLFRNAVRGHRSSQPACPLAGKKLDGYVERLVSGLNRIFTQPRRQISSAVAGSKVTWPPRLRFGCSAQEDVGA
jgi:hypothetical protein